MSDNTRNLAILMADLEEEALLEAVKLQIDDQVDPLAIFDECREGIKIVGERFANGDYFVSDLIFSAEMMNNVLSLLEPLMISQSTSDKPAIKVVIGTVQGDIHDIGKNLVVSMLRCNGFDVYDVGIDVPPQVFVDKLRETGARVVGLSGLLTVAYPTMKATIEAIAKDGLRDKVKVIIGGGMVDEMICAQVGADAWGRDAIEAVSLINTLLGGKVQ